MKHGLNMFGEPYPPRDASARGASPDMMEQWGVVSIKASELTSLRTALAQAEKEIEAARWWIVQALREAGKSETDIDRHGFVKRMDATLAAARRVLKL